MSASAPKAKGTRTAPSHPPVLEMVKVAIASNNDRKGASLAVIKKHISTYFKVEIGRIAPHLRRAIVHGVESGYFVRVGNRGTGASGSFRLAGKTAEKKATGSAKTKKATPGKEKKKSATPTATSKASGAATKTKAPTSKAEKEKAKKPATGRVVKKAAPKAAPKAAKPKTPIRPAGARSKVPARKPRPATPRAKKPVAKKSAKA